MQPPNLRDLSFGTGAQDDPQDDAQDEQDENEETAAPGDSIRDLQRRRRDTARLRSDMEALIAAPLDDDEEDDEIPQGAPGAPPPAKVWVVFQGAKWEDPEGALRESDSITGVFATEEAAWRAAGELRKTQKDREDAWYQPYNVQEAG